MVIGAIRLGRFLSGLLSHFRYSSVRITALIPCPSDPPNGKVSLSYLSDRPLLFGASCLFNGLGLDRLLAKLAGSTLARAACRQWAVRFAFQARAPARAATRYRRLAARYDRDGAGWHSGFVVSMRRAAAYVARADTRAWTALLRWRRPPLAKPKGAR
jgi:hypothetical protein